MYYKIKKNITGEGLKYVMPACMKLSPIILCVYS